MSSLTHSLNGIVLGTFPLGESDKVVTFLTREKGLVKAVYYGVRKKNSNLAASVELCNHVEIMISDPKSVNSDLYSIRDLYLIYSFHRIREDYHTITYLFFLIEFIKVFLFNENEPKIYFDMLRKMLTFCERDLSMCKYLIFAFIYKTLYLGGFLSDFSVCPRCGEKFINQGFLTRKDGWIYCQRCTHNDDGNRISIETIRLIRIFFFKTFEDIIELEINDDLNREIKATTIYLAQNISGRQFKSVAMLGK